MNKAKTKREGEELNPDGAKWIKLKQNDREGEELDGAKWIKLKQKDKEGEELDGAKWIKLKQKDREGEKLHVAKWIELKLKDREGEELDDAKWINVKQKDKEGEEFDGAKWIKLKLKDRKGDELNSDGATWINYMFYVTYWQVHYNIIISLYSLNLIEYELAKNNTQNNNNTVLVSTVWRYYDLEKRSRSQAAVWTGKYQQVLQACRLWHWWHNLYSYCQSV